MGILRVVKDATEENDNKRGELMNFFQNKIEKDFEFFLKNLSALEPIEFCGLAKLLGVQLVQQELVDFDEQEFLRLKENESFQSKLAETLVPMDVVLEEMMDKYLGLKKKRRKEINELLREIKKEKNKKEASKNGSTA